MAIGEIAEAILRRDRALVIGALALVTAIAWVYTFLCIGMPEMMGGNMGTTTEEQALMLRRMAWTPTYALLMFLMWWIMMIAMMVPSAAPMALLLAAASSSPPAFISLRPSNRPASTTAGIRSKFIIRHWRAGSAGALRMGVEHGAYCLGCCWFLMALLFVGAASLRSCRRGRGTRAASVA